MKRYYLITIVVVVSCFLTQAQNFYIQYFENPTFSSADIKVEPEVSAQNIWQIGEPDKILFDSAVSLPRVIMTDTINNYPHNNVSRFTLKIGPNNWSHAVFALKWMQKLDIDSGDIGFVEFSVNSGQSWQNAFNNPYVYNFYGFNSVNQVTVNGQAGFGKTDSSWKNIWLCFSSAFITVNTNSLMVRFTFQSDTGGISKEGWIIDNIHGSKTALHTVGIGDKPASNEYLSVYPNPANDLLYIEAQKLNTFHLIEKMDLLDRNGAVLKSWEKIPTKFWIETRDLPEGSYYLRIRTNIREKTLPFIVKR